MALSVAVMSCKGPAGQDSSGEVIDMTIAGMVSEPLEFEGKTVRFEGVIDHMCRHSGDKMRIVQLDDSEMSLQVMLGDLMDEFRPEYEGSEILITGTFRTQVLNMDELAQQDEDHGCESTEEALKLMAERGIDPNVRPYVELRNYTIR